MTRGFVCGNVDFGKSRSTGGQVRAKLEPAQHGHLHPDPRGGVWPIRDDRRRSSAVGPQEEESRLGANCTTISAPGNGATDHRAGADSNEPPEGGAARHLHLRAGAVRMTDSAMTPARQGDQVGVVCEFQTWLVRLRCKAKIEQVGNERLDDLRASLAAACADPKKAPAFGQAMVAFHQELQAEIADELTVTKDRVMGVLNESFDTPWSTLHEAFDARDSTTPIGRVLALIDDDLERGLLHQLSLRVRRREFEKSSVASALELVEEVEAMAIAAVRRLQSGRVRGRPEDVPADLRASFDEARDGVRDIVRGVDLPPCAPRTLRNWFRDHARVLGLVEQQNENRGPALQRPLVRGLLTLHAGPKRGTVPPQGRNG